MRLQKLLALMTKLSRREAEREIDSGHVRVNGKVVTKQGVVVDPTSDRVEIFGKPISKLKPVYIYIAYYKPKGLLVTSRDPYERATIWIDLKKYEGHVSYVGRLDRNSEGLLLLTNDGDLANRLTHPKHDIYKEYKVEIDGVVNDDQIRRLRNGVELEDGMTLPCKVDLLVTNKSKTILSISIREGRKRQIRRMCEAIGHQVTRLKRVAIGPIKLGSLKPREHRFLNREEIKKIKGAYRV
ncbi:MAG: pseudouridine synthase [Pseudomonadota bacterium]